MYSFGTACRKYECVINNRLVISRVSQYSGKYRIYAVYGK